MNLAAKQFRVLIWKCWIQRKRHYLTTTFELLFSLLANIIMVFVINSINQKLNLSDKMITRSNTTPWVNETIWPVPLYNFQEHFYKFVYAKPKILYSPDNNVTRTFIRELESVMTKRVCLSKTNVKYIGFNNENDLLNGYAKLNKKSDIDKGLIGIIFQLPASIEINQNPLTSETKFEPDSIFTEEMNYFLNRFSYKIRTSSLSINGFYPEKETAGPYKKNLYLEEDSIKKTFLETQIFINEAYLSLLLKREKISLINQKAEKYFKDKSEAHQKMVEEFYKMMGIYKKSIDYTSNSLGKVNDSEEQLEFKKDEDLFNHILNNQNGESKEHLEFLKHALEILITQHPLFVQNIRARRIPYPSYIERPPNSLIDLIPYVITNGFIILVPVIVKRMTDEKVNRIRFSFRLMGLKDAIYFLSIFCNYFIGIIPQVLIISLLYTSSFFGLSTPIYQYTQTILVALILLLYCVHLILMSMLISIPFERPVIGVVISVVLFFVSGLPHYFLDIRFNKGLNPNSYCIPQIISCILPNMAINFIFRLISLKELYNYGADFNNLFELTHMYGLMSIGIIMIIQILSCVMISLLILYLDAVWPDEFGLSRHWLFPVKNFIKWAKYGKKINHQERDFDNYYKFLNVKSIRRPKGEDPDIRKKYFEDEENFDKDKIAILVRNLRKVYKTSKVALDCVNLKLLKGQLTALLGVNGAGKTTLINIITGFMNWNEGSVFINGYNVKTQTKLAREFISLCPQQNCSLYDELTAFEHLYLYSVIKGEPSYRIEYDIGVMLDKLQLTKKSKVPSGVLSGGMKRKLNLAIALIGNSKIVILDEPTSGMDPSSRRTVWDLLLEARRSKTILLSTHYLEEADAVSDKICIMSNGQVHCYGTPVFLKRSFGTGYQLRIAKSTNFTLKNRERLDKFINDYFTNSKRYLESQGELIYLLNGNTDTSCSEMVEDGQLANFFNEFEALKESLEISSCGISVTTLEDVFLRVTTSDQFVFDIQYNNNTIKKNENLSLIDFGRKGSNIHFENAIKEDISLTSYKEKNKIDFSDMTDVELSSSCNDSTLGINPEIDEIENCFLLAFQRFKGLMIKRYHYLRETYIMFATQLLIPLIVFTIIIYADQFLRSRLHFDQPFELDYKTMYGSERAFGYFQRNNETKFGKYYSENAKFHGIKIDEISLNEDLNREILDNKVWNIGMSGYIQNLLISLTEQPAQVDDYLAENDMVVTQKAFDVWFNNEVLHSLPISINLLYESIFRYFNLSSTAAEADSLDSTEALRIHTVNHPFPNQLHYIYHFTSIQQFKIMWSLIASLTLPFLAAYYSVFPIQEQLTRSKLLQTMTGLSLRLYWLSNFIGDFIIHFVECVLIIGLFYMTDNVGIFINFNETLVGLFLLILLYGVCSIFMAYIYSHLAPEVSTGYVLYVIFNLIFGLILSLCDYIIFYLTEFAVLRKITYQKIIGIFRIFPLYSMTQGIVNLYVTGSKAHVCDNLNKQVLLATCNANNKDSIIFGCCKDICGDSCHEYKSPFNWSPDGILNELLMMSICAIVSFFALVFLETKISLRYCLGKLWNKSECKKASFFIEDLDVSLERNRIDQLVETTDISLINRDNALIVQNLSKKYQNGHLAVKKISFGVQNQECFGFLGINGAGKTTTFRMLVGDLKPTSGNAFINGYDLRSNLKKFQQQIGYVPQFDALLDNLTGEEMLYLFGRLRGVKECYLKQRVLEIVRMTDLVGHFKNLSSSYSGGTRRKLSLAISLLGNPKIIFLDEPTAGVDVSSRRKIWRTLVYLKKVHNCSILLTSHSMEECEALCTRLAIMVNGQFKCLNGIQHLRKKYGQGFTLTIKMSQKYANSNNNSEYIRKLKEKLTSTFNQCILKDIHQTVITYQILDTSLSWSFLFKSMDLIKKEFNLEYYLIGDTTLEQIFIAFARQE